MTHEAMAAHAAAPRAVRRSLFVVTILTGSFLLFMVQPMVARMALPQLGGAPNVWNSAMLVYQALLLGGYAYAHLLGRMPMRRQATIHLALLAIAALTLPVGLVGLPPPRPGWEVVWAPALLGLSIGPVFLLVSAQAPLMQRWYSLDPQAGAPWALYAASNLGSFAGLIAYPLVAEPLLSIRQQSLVWTLGFALLVLLIALTAWSRWNVGTRAGPAAADAGAHAPHEVIGARRIVLWLALAAVPSGLMLSTTTHLTTDIFAMPLLWVIPLGLYLLSFVVAFSDRRFLARILTLSTPMILLLVGGLAMMSTSSGSMTIAFASVALLFLVSVALHARLYDSRPPAAQLTLFYFVMSAGGALGGLFTALIAPVVFDWVWEHPLLLLAAAALLPLFPVFDWRQLRGVEPGMVRIAAILLFGAALFLGFKLSGVVETQEADPTRGYYLLAIAAIGFLLLPWRWLYVGVLALLMVAQGGSSTMRDSWDGVRSRSYFGIYTVRDIPSQKMRTLAHGTTLHGQQSTDSEFTCAPMTYYGRSSGVGVTLTAAQRLFGPAARIGVVGLGTGTLAAYSQPGERWTFFEIDPAVLDMSRSGTFTFLSQCGNDPAVALGDARLELAKAAPASFDVLAIDAFSSDAIPLHLMTDEAIGVYLRALSSRGILVIHISNRFIDLEPVLAAAAKHRGLAVAIRKDSPDDDAFVSGSNWVVMTRDPGQLEALGQLRPDAPLSALTPPAAKMWTDDHASILPYVQWRNMLKAP